jgi:hypothetical protein
MEQYNRKKRADCHVQDHPLRCIFRLNCGN